MSIDKEQNKKEKEFSKKLFSVLDEEWEKHIKDKEKQNRRK